MWKRKFWSFKAINMTLLSKTRMSSMSRTAALWKLGFFIWHVKRFLALTYTDGQPDSSGLGAPQLWLISSKWHNHCHVVCDYLKCIFFIFVVQLMFIFAESSAVSSFCYVSDATQDLISQWYQSSALHPSNIVYHRKLNHNTSNYPLWSNLSNINSKYKLNYYHLICFQNTSCTDPNTW